MPTLNWIGKDAVINHHLEVPFHLLKDVPELACGEPGSGNLIVEGDNLVALKALLPYYKGKVKCICIDPPYNTGEEGWIYNDNVNSPVIRQWMKGTVEDRKVTKEKLDRHDRWLCMMFPRLALLKELLSKDGLIAVAIDDNEVYALGALMDELFGPQNRLACAPWKAEPSGGKGKGALRIGHEYVLIYHGGDPSKLQYEEQSSGQLDLNDSKGKYRKGRELRKWGGESLREDREEMWFPLMTPDGVETWPYKNDGREGRWRWGKNGKMKSVLIQPDEAHWEMCPYDDGVVVGGATERWVPFEKVRNKNKVFGWGTWLDAHGYNADATRELKEIFGNKPFDTPKPLQLITWVLSLHGDENGVVLDSFSGSATTGHAALRLNQEDESSRPYILIEMEPVVARHITRERMKRVTEGYTNSHGVAIPGLGGGFRYVTLGDQLFDEHGRINEAKVRFADLARHVYFSETGEPLPKERISAKTPLLGVHHGRAVYLLYNGILKDKSVDGGNVLTTTTLDELPAHDGPKVVYAAGCRFSKARLEREGITFKQTLDKFNSKFDWKTRTSQPVNDLPFIEGPPSQQKVRVMNKWVKDNTDIYNPKFVKFYHATHPSHEIEKEGLLPTSSKRRLSYQSQPGYVYLANTPERAKMFGDLGNQGKSVVYEVIVEVSKLLPDKDQINNQRSVGADVGDSVGDSIVYGGGVRVKGRLQPWQIKKIEL